MKHFILKLLRFLGLPLLAFTLLAIPYVLADPYDDFGQKKNYSWTYFFQHIGDQATKKLLHSPREYNGFILGSSRALSVYACYLNHKFPHSSFFHYANWNETIGGIYHKLEWLDRTGYALDYVLIYVDTDYTFKNYGEVRDFDHYLITGQTAFDYYTQHINSFYGHMNGDKLKILLGMEVSGQVYPNWHSDLITNDANHNCSDDSILINYATIDKSRTLKASIDSMRNVGYMYERSVTQQYMEPQISSPEIRMLNDLKALLDKHHSDYYIIITPLYDQQKFHPDDQAILKSLFGKHLYDYSGINAITNDIYNFPDRHHFQPYVSKNIIDAIINPLEPSLLQAGIDAR